MASRIQRVRAPAAGLDADNAQDYIAEGYAPVLDNMLPRGGRAVMRGGWSRYVNTAVNVDPAKNNATQGLMVFDDQFIMRAYGATLHTHFNLTTNVKTSLSAAPTIQSTRYARVGAYVYGPGSPAPLNSVPLLRWPGGAVLPTSLNVNVAPAGACDVIAHLERVWVMGAALNTAGGRSALMWTIPGGTSATPVATDWQDPVSGLFNQILVGSTDGDDLVAFGKAARSLVVFKKRSMYFLTGQTPATFQIHRFSDQIGCVSRDSVCSFNDGTYFLSERGLMYFDGAQAVEISKPVRAEMQYAIRRAKLLSDFPYYSVADIGQGCISVIIGNYATTPGSDPLSSTVPFAQYIYDTVRNTWTTFTFGAYSDALQSQRMKPNIVFWCKGLPVLCDGFQIGYVDTIVSPEFPTTNGGKDTYWDGAAVADKTASIMARWRSRMFPLNLPLSASQVTRLMLDYRMVTAAAAVAANCWTVELYNGSGEAIYSGSALASNGGASAIGLYKQRFVDACYAETSDVQIRATYLDQGATPPTVVEAAIYDGAIEYSSTQNANVGVPAA